MKKRLALVVVLTTVLVLAMALPALASPESQGRSRPIVDVTYRLTNNYAWSPYVGVWGLMDEFMHVRVWQTGENSFREEYTMLGKWRTWAGVPSPKAGIPQGHNGSGVVLGYGALTFDAPGLDPQDGFATRGYIGTFDVGGKQADMGSPNIFPPGMVSFGGWYFPGTTDLAFVDLLQVYNYGYQSFIMYLATPGSPWSFGFKGEIVIR